MDVFFPCECEHLDSSKYVFPIFWCYFAYTVSNTVVPYMLWKKEKKKENSKEGKDERREEQRKRGKKKGQKVRREGERNIIIDVSATSMD